MNVCKNCIEQIRRAGGKSGPFLTENHMGNESGTWIMYGVDWDDPECIHTVDEAIEYINKVGFLPLLN